EAGLSGFGRVAGVRVGALAGTCRMGSIDWAGTRHRPVFTPAGGWNGRCSCRGSEPCSRLAERAVAALGFGQLNLASYYPPLSELTITRKPITIPTRSIISAVLDAFLAPSPLPASQRLVTCAEKYIPIPPMMKEQRNAMIESGQYVDGLATVAAWAGFCCELAGGGGGGERGDLLGAGPGPGTPGGGGGCVLQAFPSSP